MKLMSDFARIEDIKEDIKKDIKEGTKKEDHKKTLIHCTILTMDEEDRHYLDGSIRIHGNRIVEIGNYDEIEGDGEIIDMKGRIILPGFINTHTHSPSPLCRGMADDLELMDWLKKRIWPIEKNLNHETAYWGSSLTFLEFLETGVTTFADQYFFADSIAKAAMNSGLRCFMAPTVFSGSSPESEDTIQMAVDFIEKYKGREAQTLIYPCIGPHAPYSCSDEVLKTVAEIARKMDLLVHIHISETADENREIIEKTGLSPTLYLEKMGLLEQRVLAAHCIHLDEKDLQVFREKKVSVSYNPVSNLKLVSGFMPMKRMAENKITVSIGTDGAQSNNSLDLLGDLKTGVLIQKQINQDATFLPARDALRMITINGAKALGMENEIGSLEKGKLADLISMDIESTNIYPLHKTCLSNLYSGIVYSAKGLNVCDVMVNGEFLLKNRKAKRVNKSEILANAQKSGEYLMTKAGLI